MGPFKAVEPMVPKETIGPAIVVPAPTDPSALAPLAKDGAQAAAGLRGSPTKFSKLARGNSRIPWSMARTQAVRSTTTVRRS